MISINGLCVISIGIIYRFKDNVAYIHHMDIKDTEIISIIRPGPIQNQPVVNK